MVDKKELIALKDYTVRELHRIDVGSYNLHEADKRLSSYIIGCIANPTKHNVYELLAISRFFLFMEKYEFRLSEVRRFIIFYERLKFSGTKGRRCYKLTPIQVFQFANIMGFYRSKNKRLCREALLFVPRKFSKTTSVASLAIYDLIFGDHNAQAYVAANTYKQATICFNEIRGILKSLDSKLRHFKINREIIYNKRKGKESFAQCLASNPDKLDGLNASLVILDEYAQADSADLKNVLTSSMGIRINPLTVVITTASEKRDTPLYDMLDAYKSVLRGEMDNDSIFAHIFQPDVDDEESDPQTWAKVQPHLGITVQSDFYALEYDKALLTSEDMKNFRTKYLNLFVQDSSKVWFTAEEIEALKKDIKLEKLVGRPEAMVAVDLSVCDDFSAVSYALYSAEAKAFHVHTDYYFPKGALVDHANAELYRKWAKDGDLILCDGDVIDYRMIVNDILIRNKYLCILGIGYDPYRSVEFVNMLSASGAGGILQPVRQTYSTFTSPVESFELTAKIGKVSFNDNPINWYCFGNALMDEDKNENRKPIKRSHREKIDGVITVLMCFYLFNNLER